VLFMELFDFQLHIFFAHEIIGTLGTIVNPVQGSARSKMINHVLLFVHSF